MTCNSATRESIFRQLNLICGESSLKPQNESETQFLEHVKSYVRQVQLYEQQRLREAVNRTVPVKELLEKAMKKRDTLRNENKCDVNTRDLLLVELLCWFKNSFFSWFDVPHCDKCSNLKMSLSSNDKPTSEEKANEASRVEVYVCSSCGAIFRFARYNNPIKLLETRKGRCGEWANCFCAILHALDYEMRFVIDWTDHVWTEVYSETEKRWIHCDPCENAMDTPLMYEHGWNKKLIYCIAFSCYELQDVTWRYTTKTRETMGRRATKCRESWIISLLLRCSSILQQPLSKDKKEYLRDRRLRELVDFLWIPNQQRTVKDSELQGRQSGSVLWRVQRGEIGVQPICVANFTFEMSESNASVTYNCAKDEYMFGNKILKGWSSCAHQFNNVFRKEENDWKMCYLSRCESGVPGEGFIVWNIDVSKVKWTRVDIRLSCQTYSTGVIDISVVTLPEEKVLNIKNNETNTIERSSVAKCDTLRVKATFRGGTSQVGWQHAQLFRQSLVNDREKNAFEIKVKFD